MVESTLLPPPAILDPPTDELAKMDEQAAELSNTLLFPILDPTAEEEEIDEPTLLAPYVEKVEAACEPTIELVPFNVDPDAAANLLRSEELAVVADIVEPILEVPSTEVLIGALALDTNKGSNPGIAKDVVLNPD